MYRICDAQTMFDVCDQVLKKTFPKVGKLCHLFGQIQWLDKIRAYLAKLKMHKIKIKSFCCRLSLSPCSSLCRNRSKGAFSEYRGPCYRYLLPFSKKC